MAPTDIDLSRLPEPIREKLQARLDRLPSEVRAKLVASLAKLPQQAQAELLAHGSPMLEKLLDRLEKGGAGKGQAGKGSHATSTVGGHVPTAVKVKTASGLYSQTVQRGDRLSLPLGLIVLVIGGMMLLLYRFGLLA